MIDLQDVLHIHKVLVEQFGGIQGVRDAEILISALERPFSGFGEEEFYSSPSEKASAIVESIVRNHPFLDGNKRTGYTVMRLLLMHYGKDIQATQDEKVNFTLSVASGQLNYEQILAWIEAHLIER